MSIFNTICFKSSEKDCEAWQKMLAGLYEGKQGAWLEEQFERFGEAAEQEIEQLMDDCEETLGRVWFEGFNANGNQFECALDGNFDAHHCLPRIKQLLSVCGATDININMPEE
ncbi:hypothetical protein [Gilvimarinus sp. 1_MG-2023]|uniref:hypothetical protein n=1 Tax=Gilvimarinus sp. 1_MG-2023 TaxID=3062638 RepID=UPI0026E3C447|nr:hypothetical protein [Gilvimarinus sp. 1_MG-2023]MDO6748470.1 hypothetical protein [Gilvimarinus sp. 1_MG-2023]